MRWRGLALGACVLSFAPIAAAFISKTEDYAWQAVLLVAVVIAHLCAQQMFDAYLPLLAKSHPRSVAARAAREAGLKDAGLKDQRGPRTSQHGGKGVKDEVEEKEEVDAEAPVDHDAKVSATRQEVASELAFFAPAMGFACMTLITLVQMAIIFRTNQQDAKDDLPRQEGDPNNVGRGLRLSIVIAGGWAMVCCWIGLRGLRIRPGRPLPFGLTVWRRRRRRQRLCAWHPLPLGFVSSTPRSSSTNYSWVLNGQNRWTGAKGAFL